MTLEAAFISLNRFGYGADQAGLRAVTTPKETLRQQIENPQIPDTLQDQGGLEMSWIFLQAARNKDNDKALAAIEDLRKEYNQFVADLTKHRLQTQQPFVERMVAFWTNHFTVSMDKKSTLGLYRDYQYRAIRPHVTGYFADMLIAVAQHPAMLTYLDNVNSFGNNSKIAERYKRGLNENLAREILELHTLGVNGGYTQKDVIELAKMLTGWGVDAPKKNAGGMQFAFNKFAHEPNKKVLLGQTFKPNGMNEALDALRMIATHKSTARFLSEKLARYFVSDAPPESLIRQLETAYVSSGGHLGTVMKALIDAPESWEEPLSKIKPVPDFVVSAFRAVGYAPSEGDILKAYEAMDYKPFGASSPDGFSVQNVDLASPNAVMKRIEWAQDFAQKLDKQIDPYALAQNLFGTVMQEETAFAIKGAETGTQGIVLLLMSPEFQKR
jgi:uncharacterized protein (DUF1800 family)